MTAKSRSTVAGRPPAAATLTPRLLLALQAFDAAFRLGSFRGAGEALNITPSAISHRIRQLEQRLGHALFVRTHRAIEPTAKGRALAAGTGRAFAELARAAASTGSEDARLRLRVAVVPTFAASWLIPRIAEFTARHPHIELVIEGVPRAVDFDNEPFDAAIRSGSGEWPGLAVTELMRFQTVPICTPRLAAELNLKSPADLARATLINVTAFPHSWPAWFQQAGIPAVTPRRAIWFDSFGAAQAAAQNGVGVALGLDPLFSASERDGSLCRPLSIGNPAGSYWFVHRPLDARAPALQTFRRWLQAAIAI